VDVVSAVWEARWIARRELRTLLDGGAFWEAPRWHTGRWWVSDFYTHAVTAVDPDGSSETVLEVGGQPSGLGWLPDGSLLVASMRDQRILRRTPDGAVAVHADLSGVATGNLNDMVVGPAGHAYVGCFGFDAEAGEDPAPGALWRVEPGGAVSPAAGGLLFPNGGVITADGDTLIVAETAGARLTAFAIGADGGLGDRRIWAQVAPPPRLGTFAETVAALRFGPDGCTLDAEERVWAADIVGGRCARVAPGGAVVDEVPAPDGLTVIACMLGGEDGRTLLLCAAPDFVAHNRMRAREAVLLAARVDVPHAGWP
jgi:sugar lactone lactonase YvrE